jgi:hypothetical protein
LSFAQIIRAHTSSVQPTRAGASLFEIKLLSGKLVMSSFQHMVTICGARKSFFLIILTFSILMEAIDLQKEILSGTNGLYVRDYRKLFLGFNN